MLLVFFFLFSLLSSLKPPSMSETHLELLQPEDWTRPSSYSGSAKPLFLIHDGGGTIFTYAFLPPLHRFVYGIRNPHFASGETFAGGVPEMGRLYAGWIRETVARRRDGFPALRSSDGGGIVDIILGGWSFGGLLSLEVAKVLEGDAGVRVTGLLLIDTVFPSAEATAKPTPPPGDGPRSKNQLLSERAMEDARGMVRKWTPPVWEPASRRPRAVLLRAGELIPWTESGLDLERGRPGSRLGWDHYDGKMFEDVVALEGHHFELFTGERLEGTADGIRRALDILEDR